MPVIAKNSFAESPSGVPPGLGELVTTFAVRGTGALALPCGLLSVGRSFLLLLEALSADARLPMESIAAGAAVGLIECAVCQPFDMVKTRHHLSSHTRSVASSLRAIHAEGGFLRFYRGVGPEFAGMVPKSAAMYSSYDGARQLLLAHTSLDEVAASFAAGAASGPFEAAVVQPFQALCRRTSRGLLETLAWT